jgi:cell wall-associated NlpC family hydrolase
MLARPQRALGMAIACALTLTIAPAADAQAVLPKPFERLGIWSSAEAHRAAREWVRIAESRGNGASAATASGARELPAIREQREAVVAIARAQLGKRYRLGGSSPDGGFDCSGLVKFIASSLGLDLPRTAQQQASVGLEVVRDPGFLRPGDLLTFGGRDRVTHIGIYIGDGRFIHASSVAGRVVESRVDRPLGGAVRPWTGIRRVIIASEATSANPRG